MLFIHHTAPENTQAMSPENRAEAELVPPPPAREPSERRREGCSRLARQPMVAVVVFLGALAFLGPAGVGSAEDASN